MPVTISSSLSLILSSEPGDTFICTPDFTAIILILYLNLASRARREQPEYFEPTGTVIVSTASPFTPRVEIFLS